jgi:hypothetical protein
MICQTFVLSPSPDSSQHLGLAFSISTQLMVVTVRGSRLPRGMPLVIRMAALQASRRGHQCHPRVEILSKNAHCTVLPAPASCSSKPDFHGLSDCYRWIADLCACSLSSPRCCVEPPQTPPCLALLVMADSPVKSVMVMVRGGLDEVPCFGDGWFSKAFGLWLRVKGLEGEPCW